MAVGGAIVASELRTALPRPALWVAAGIGVVAAVGCVIAAQFLVPGSH